MKISVPPRIRPLVALGLALLAGGLEAMVRGGLTWQAFSEGLQNGFMAAGGAVYLIQEVFVRGILNGKTEPPPSAVLLAVLFFAGCGNTPGDQAIAAITESIGPIDEQAHKSYDRDLSSCAGDAACLDKVKAGWAPAIEALQRIRKVWCAVKPADCEGAK